MNRARPSCRTRLVATSAAGLLAATGALDENAGAIAYATLTLAGPGNSGHGGGNG
jgi:hypothetical protein